MGSKKLDHDFDQHSHWRRQLSQVLSVDSDQSRTEAINVGWRLKEIRVLQGLSQRELADLSGLSFNTISLIENEKTSPSVNTLQQLAIALNVPIRAFFEPTGPMVEVVFQKSGERPRTSFEQGIFSDLGGGLSLGRATPLLMTLGPDEEDDPDPIVHTGQEFVYCLEGRMKFWIADSEYDLEPGDSLIFQASLPHCWKNPGDHLARAIIVIAPSDIRDLSVTKHLDQKLGE